MKFKDYLNEESAEAKTAKEIVKRIDNIGDQLDKIEKEYETKVSGKGGSFLKRLGLDDSISISSKRVDMLHKDIVKKMEDLQVAFSDLANAIDNYHLNEEFKGPEMQLKRIEPSKGTPKEVVKLFDEMWNLPDHGVGHRRQQQIVKKLKELGYWIRSSRGEFRLEKV